MIYKGKSMNVIGIIAEYNPFHNGHAYQIKKIKEELHADFVVVAMSGDFVQRGAPAIIDKYARTEMALSNGADLVIELPVLWATASAEYFATAGVTLFEKMGCVDGICFGAETDNLAALSLLADILADEPEEYRRKLSFYLKQGFAFPMARSKALKDYFLQNPTLTLPLSSDSLECDISTKFTTILDTPNNILAIEYLKALKKRNSLMTPYVIKREGAGYHEESILDSSSFAPSVPTASATAIRKELFQSAKAFHDSSFNIFDDTLETAMPASALAVLNNYLTTNKPVCTNDFSSILGYQLLCSDAATLSDIGDLSLDLANRILKNRSQFIGFEQFCNLCKSKDVAYTRLSRVFMQLILGIKKADYSCGISVDYVPYLRILGFRKNSSVLLKELKAGSKVPIISKLADAASLLDETAMLLLRKDIFAADLYSQLCVEKGSVPTGSEFTRNIVRF